MSKYLYIIAGGSDGYVELHYTFDRKVIEKFAEDSEDDGDWSEWERIPVQDDATYESLGILYPIESM